MGTDTRCPELRQATCQAANFDCYWERDDPKGTCEGNDNRCPGVGEERCASLQATGASCRWALAQEFEEESSDLEEEVSALTGYAADMEVLLEDGGRRALTLQRALSFLQQTALPARLRRMAYTLVLLPRDLGDR